MKHNVVLDGEVVERLVAREMGHEIRRLIRVLKWRRKGSQGGIFHNDPDKDLSLIHI